MGGNCEAPACCMNTDDTHMEVIMPKNCYTGLESNRNYTDKISFQFTTKSSKIERNLKPLDWAVSKQA